LAQTALELLRAWAVVWAQTVLLQKVLLQMLLARPVRGRLVGSQAFVVLLDATRAASR
tara:strand:- start:215 stop:388 length:174 start_codon:yes stop_codon:yes gene_type:complete